MYHIQEDSKVNSAERKAIVAVQQLVMNHCHHEEEREAEQNSAAQLCHSDALKSKTKIEHSPMTWL